MIRTAVRFGLSAILVCAFGACAPETSGIESGNDLAPEDVESMFQAMNHGGGGGNVRNPGGNGRNPNNPPTDEGPIEESAPCPPGWFSTAPPTVECAPGFTQVFGFGGACFRCVPSNDECDPDTTPPSMTCPLPVAFDSCSREVPIPPATDNCNPPPTVTASPSVISGNGIHTVTYTATDASGNTTTCTTDYQLHCPCTDPPAGLSQWWPFDEPTAFVAEELVIDDDGLYFGSTGTTGKVAGAHRFNGVSDYMHADDNADPGDGSVTIDAWIRGGGSGVRAIADYSGFLNLGLYVWNNRLVLLHCGDIGTLGCSVAVSTGTVSGPGWNFVAATYDHDSGATSFFINGVPEAGPNFGNRSWPAPTPPPYWTVGATEGLGGAFFFRGGLDEVEIFHRALTTAELRDIWEADAGGKCKDACVEPPPNMQAWWPFDDGSSGVSFDIRNSNHAGHTGTPVPYASNYVGNSLEFTGPDSVAVIPDSPDVRLGEGGVDYSIDFWMWRADANVPGDFLWPTLLATRVLGGPGNGFVLSNWALDGLHFHIFGAAGSPNFDVFNYPMEEWAFVAITVDIGATSSTVKFYLNGVLESTFVHPGSLATVYNSGDKLIGAQDVDFAGNTIGQYLGKLDELEFHRGVLSAAQVLELYEAGRFGKCKDGCDPDTVDPYIECPLPLSFENCEDDPASLLGSAFAVDNCALDSVTAGAPVNISGDQWQITYTATDASGNTASCTVPFQMDCSDCVDVPPDMWAWWTMDETSGTVANEITNGQDGNHVGSVASAAGMVNGARDFSGGGWISANRTVTHDYRDLTIDAWIYPYSIGGQQTIIHYKSNFYGLHLSGSEVSFHISPIPLSWGGTTTGANIQPNRWTHLAVVADTSTASHTVYVDGVPFPLPAIYSGVTGFHVGSGWDIGASYNGNVFNGLIDEVEIFERVLSQAEIQTLVDARDDGKCRCPDAGAPDVSYVSHDPAFCAVVSFICQPGQTAFDDECGCGCLGFPVICPDPDDAAVRYISTDPSRCSPRVNLQCAADEREFRFDECGCGCERECPERDDPTIRLVNEDPAQCEQLDLNCPAGMAEFRSACGCGCR